MKTRIIFSTALILLISFTTYAQQVEKFDTTLWVNNISIAKTAAAEKGHPIMLVFSGSDWCKPCIKLKTQILLTETFSAYAKDHYILLNLDFPRKTKNKLSDEQQAHNDELASKYNMEGVFPLVVIIDADGKVLATSGYLDISPAEYIANLESLLVKK